MPPPASYPPTPRFPPSETASLIKDVSIIGAVIVVIVIIMISFTVFMVIKFLRNVVDKAEAVVGPTSACAAQIAASQSLYRQKVNPATGEYYTKCAAANLAVSDAAKDPGTTCPKVAPPYSARPPYSVYISTQCAPPPPEPD